MACSSGFKANKSHSEQNAKRLVIKLGELRMASK